MVCTLLSQQAMYSRHHDSGQQALPPGLRNHCRSWQKTKKITTTCQISSQLNPSNPWILERLKARGLLLERRGIFKPAGCSGGLWIHHNPSAEIHDSWEASKQTFVDGWSCWEHQGLVQAKVLESLSLSLSIYLYISIYIYMALDRFAAYILAEIFIFAQFIVQNAPPKV